MSRLFTRNSTVSSGSARVSPTTSTVTAWVNASPAAPASNTSTLPKNLPKSRPGPRDAAAAPVRPRSAEAFKRTSWDGDADSDTANSISTVPESPSATLTSATDTTTPVSSALSSFTIVPVASVFLA